LAEPAKQIFSKSFGINPAEPRHLLLGRGNMLSVGRITGPALHSELISMPLTKEGYGSHDNAKHDSKADI
jgi:hypothetical protein